MKFYELYKFWIFNDFNWSYKKKKIVSSLVFNYNDNKHENENTKTMYV